MDADHACRAVASGTANSSLVALVIVALLGAMGCNRATPVSALAWSSDGSSLAFGDDGGYIKVRSLATGKCIHSVKADEFRVCQLRYAPDGATLLAALSGCNVVIRNSDTLEAVASWNDVGNVIAISPDGQLLATANSKRSPDYPVELWRIADRTKILSVDTRHRHYIRSIAFSPDGTRFATGSRDGSINVRNAATGSLEARLSGDMYDVWQVAYSPDGTLIAAATRANTIDLWDAIGTDRIARLNVHTSDVSCIAFSPDADLLASGSWDHTVRLWNVSTRAQIAVAQGHTDDVTCLAFAPDGRVLASAGRDGQVKLWDVPNLTERTW